MDNKPLPEKVAQKLHKLLPAEGYGNPTLKVCRSYNSLIEAYKKLFGEDSERFDEVKNYIELIIKMNYV